MKVRCGRCTGCLLDRGNMWAARCVHEAQLHRDKCFITLTYDQKHLPRGGTLVKKHAQDFMKRLRRKYGTRKILHFLCGEYGDRNERPHYHALLFGVDFSDKVLLPGRKPDNPLYRSPELDKLWGMGFCSVGELTFQSAAYCARYVLKKFGTSPVKAEVVLPDGEILHRLPEYLSVSLRPAIGKVWMDRYESDVYPDDFVVMNGRKQGVPRYYDKLHERRDVEAARQVKLERVDRASALHVKLNSTEPRLRVREAVALGRLSVHGMRSL